jgi:hypothetical protein
VSDAYGGLIECGTKPLFAFTQHLFVGLQLGYQGFPLSGTLGDPTLESLVELPDLLLGPLTLGDIQGGADNRPDTRILDQVVYVRLKITIGAVLAPPTDLYRSDDRCGTTHNLLVDLGYVPFEVLRVKEVRDHGPKEFFRPVT